MDMDWWEQAQPREEPLHCAAPQNTEDILYLGSDDGLDDATKAAKRRRYEEKGRQYLRGRPLRLFSASLRGPFERSSGWQNPWLPKNGPLPDSSVRPTITKPAVKASMRRDIYKLEGQANSTPGTRGSMRCHLPSPESNRDLQLDDFDNLDPDKRSRIQSWAKNVTGAPEKDSFWAPAPAKLQTLDNATNKRPAGNNWLKSKLSKRPKSDHPSPSALMTPTPAIPTEPIRETTSPSSAISHEASGMNQRPLLPESDTITKPSGTTQGMDQSVEESSQAIPESNYPGLEQLPAPHSSPKILNPMSLSPSDANVLGNLPASNDNISDTSSELSSLRSSEVTPACPTQHSGRAGGLQDLNTADTSHGTIEEATTSEDSHTEEADVNFESQVDQSFHYKTRPTRKDAPRPRTAEPAATVVLSQFTQTGTPVSENHQDSVMFRAQQTPKGEINGTSTRSERSISISQRESQSVAKAPSVVDNEDNQEQQKVEPPRPLDIPPSTATADTNAARKISAEQDHMSKGKADESHLPTDQDATSIDHPKSMAAMGGIPESKATCSKGSFSSTVVDGDTTLVVDAMDVDNQQHNASAFHPPERLDVVKYAESAPLLPSLAAKASSLVDSRQLSVEKPVSTSSPISLEGEKHGMIGNASPRHNSDDEETEVHIPLSQMEWGIGEPVPNSPGCSFSAAVARSRSPLSSEAVENVAGYSDQHILDNNLQQELFTMQAEPEPTTADSIMHIKTEPDGNISALDTSNGNMADSATSDLNESAIRPSQQSPWGMVIADALLDVKNEFQSANREAPQPNLITSPNTTSQLPSQQQSPWGGVEAQATVRPYESISVASLLNASPQWPRSQPNDTPGNLLHGRVLSASQPAETPNSLLRDNVSFASQPNDTPCSLLRDGVSSDAFGTPQAAQTREESPEPELSVKSFAKFNTPSPKRRPRGYKHPRMSGSRLPSTQVLLNAADNNPWGTQGSRSNRRVSFAPLPCEEKGATNMTSPQAPRPASPPPAVTPGAGDDDTDCRFQKHFDAMKTRSDHQPKVGFHERLLPSESQQMLMSPEVGAMAEAFREADGFRVPDLLVPMASSHEEEEALPVDSFQNDGPAIGVPQSPWREESQGLDAVAEVMQNLDDFLNPQWGEESDMGMAL
ncbi:hypothetical protein PG985_008831 [Apiospora marii]|uniref:Protamine P1 n=1 Tax=Apiospora marii TaxID=335849 RepID=A0ABR1RBG5_9PEZI